MSTEGVENIPIDIIETEATNTHPTKPPNKFKKPSRTEKTISDIEDIILNSTGIGGMSRPRPDTVKWLCPFTRRLLPGEEYRWCQCGKSEDIFCDDTCTQEPTNRGPLIFQVQDKSRYPLCGCRYTAVPPFCDGAHIHPHVGQDEWLEKYPEAKEELPWIIAQREAEAPGCCKNRQTEAQAQAKEEEGDVAGQTCHHVHDVQ